MHYQSISHVGEPHIIVPKMGTKTIFMNYVFIAKPLASIIFVVVIY